MLEFAFVLVVMMFIANPAMIDLLFGQLPRRALGQHHVYSFLTNQQSAGAGSGSMVIWAVVFLVSGILFFTHCFRRSVLLASLPLLLFVGYLGATTLWSDDPNTTIVRVGHLLGKTLFAIYVTVRFSMKGVFLAALLTLNVVLVSGWLVGIVAPDVGWQTYRDGTALRGMFTHKTGFGVVACTSLVICIGFLRAKVHRTSQLWFIVFALAFSVVTLVAAQSVSAILASLMGVLAIAIAHLALQAKSLRIRRARIFLLSLLFLVIVSISAVEFVIIAEWLGRDVSLTGRTEIWRAIISTVGSSTFFGHGYYAFWRLSPGGDLYEVLAQHGFLATSPHNAFLLAWLDGGWPSLGLFISLIGIAIRRSLRNLISDAPSVAPISIALIAVMTSIAMVESNLFKGQQIAWLLLVVVVVGPKIEGARS